jgi:predicted ATP-dependent Lon-type protease
MHPGVKAISALTRSERARAGESAGGGMNMTLKEVFRGKVVNKAHTINTGVDEFPRYVLEYLIDNYCSEDTFDQ